MEKVSMSHEDYLEAIVMLGGSDTQSVRSVDVATKLGVSKASVSKAVASLKASGMLDQPYMAISPSPQTGITTVNRYWSAMKCSPVSCTKKLALVSRSPKKKHARWSMLSATNLLANGLSILKP